MHGAEIFQCREIQLLLLNTMGEKKEPTLKSNIILHLHLLLLLFLFLLLLVHGDAVYDERLQSFCHG